MLPHGVLMSRSASPLPATAASGISARRPARLNGLPLALVLVLALAVAPFPELNAQAGAPPGGLVNTGIISGVVEDSLGAPVGGAQIGVRGLRGHGVSEDDGTFRLASVPPGPQVVVVRRIGFRPESVTVSISAGTIHEIRINIKPAPQWVAPVVIDARTAKYTGFMKGFYERRDRGNGVFFTAADIEERRPRFTTDLLRTIPGTRLVTRGPETVVTFRDRNCLPLIWIDGNAATAAYLDPDLFDPTTLAGIEVYKGPATVPASLMGLQGKGSCGVIALWTKRTDPRPKSTAKPVTAQDLANLAASLSIYTSDQVDTPVAAEPGTVMAEYPDALLSAALPGRVVVEVVVDTLGRADMDTFGTIVSTHALFTAAVRRAVAAGRFTPALLGGKRVRQLVQIPFSFVVPRS